MEPQVLHLRRSLHCDDRHLPIVGIATGSTELILLAFVVSLALFVARRYFIPRR